MVGMVSVFQEELVNAPTVQKDTERIPSASLAVYMIKLVNALQMALIAIPANKSFTVFPRPVPEKAITKTTNDASKEPINAPKEVP